MNTISILTISILFGLTFLFIILSHIRLKKQWEIKRIEAQTRLQEAQTAHKKQCEVLQQKSQESRKSVQALIEKNNNAEIENTALAGLAFIGLLFVAAIIGSDLSK